MLDVLRSRASSWVSRIFLGILVLSFALWGIGDIIFAPRGGHVVATVGDFEITVPELSREFDAELQDMRRRVDPNIDRTHPLAATALNAALQRLIALRLLDAYAADLGIIASDEEVRQHIQNDPLLQSDGRYDPGRLEFLLRSLGMSEEDYVASVRAEIVRKRVIDAFSEPIRGSEQLARLLWQLREERRSADVLLVDARAMNVADPDEATLQAYYEKNRDRFIRPEYRKVVLAVIAAADLAAEIAVDEKELRDLYEQRKERFRTAERRRLTQLLVPDEALAKEIFQQVSEGAKLEDMARSYEDRGVRLQEVGPVSRDGLPKALAEVAFSLRQGEVGGPVKTPFGWHILRVVEIEPERTKSFEEVRDELQREVAERKAAEQLPDFATSFDDELAAGTPLEEAAEKMGVKLIRIEAVDRSGRTPEGTPAAGGVLNREMLDAIFSAPEGETSLLEETRDGRYYVFRVDKVENERPLTLEEGRRRIITVYKLEQQEKAAKSLAETLLKQLETGKSPAEIAQNFPGVRQLQAEGLKRDEDGSRFGLSPEIVAAIFERREEGLLPEPIVLPGRVAVVRLTSIQPAPEPKPEDLNPVVAEVENAWRNDLLTEFEGALRRRYPVEVDNRVLAGLLGGS